MYFVKPPFEWRRAAMSGKIISAEDSAETSRSDLQPLGQTWNRILKMAKYLLHA